MHPSPFYSLIFLIIIISLSPASAQVKDPASPEDIQSLVKVSKDAQASAQSAAESAERASRAAVESGEKARAEVAEIQSGKLIASGVTGGIALGLQLPREMDSRANRDTVASTAITYIMFLPAYWFFGEPNRRYCASHWSAGSDDDATDVALNIARKSAERRIRAVIAALWRNRDSYTPETLAAHAKTLAEGYDISEKNIEEIHKIIKDQKDPTLPIEQTIIDDVAFDRVWNPTIPGRCLWTKVGVWVGKPLSYDAVIRSGAEGMEITAKSQISPVAAFGLGINVNAYVAVMFGASVSNVDFQNSVTGSTNEKKIWSWTLGIGGNLDLVGALVK